MPNQFESHVETIATLKTKVETLEKTIDKLTNNVEKLTAALNQGKGAYAFAVTSAGIVGSAIGAVITYFPNR